MCTAISIIMSADQVWLPPTDRWEHSHSAIAKAAGLAGDVYGDKLARVEVIPKDGKYLIPDGTAMRVPDADGWTVKLDEHRTPTWWSGDEPAQRDRALQAAIRWARSFEVRHAPSGTASSTGYRGTASATGYRGTASATGDYGTASATDYESVAVTLGYRGIVRAGKSGAIVCAERSDTGKLLRWVFGVVGKKGIKPNVWYRAWRGRLVQVKKNDVMLIDAEQRIAAAVKMAVAAVEGGK